MLRNDRVLEEVEEIDAYLALLVEDLLMQYSGSEEEMVDLLFTVLEELQAKGTIAEVPEVGADPVEEQEWLREALQIDLAEVVVSYIEAQDE